MLRMLSDVRKHARKEHKIRLPHALPPSVTFYANNSCYVKIEPGLWMVGLQC